MKDIMLGNHPENCKIYTPKPIAIEMIKKLKIDWKSDFKILEPAVGTGNIFYFLVQDFLEKTKDSSDEWRTDKLESSFYCFDIDDVAINDLKHKLNLLLRKYSITKAIEWQIENWNILDKDIYENVKFTHIVANPPYIDSKNLNDVQLNILRSNFSTCIKGNINMYFAFFEFGINHLSKKGRLVYITPNTYLNSKNGLAVRKLIADNNLCESVDNFVDEIIFSDALVRVCITTLTKERNDYTYRHIKKSNDAFEIINEFTIKNPFENSFLLSKKPNFKKENSLDKYFYISSGIATFEDDFYLIKSSNIIKMGEKNILFKKDNCNFKVERELLRKVIKGKNMYDGYIIYPYINEEYIDEKQYPNYKKYKKICKKNKYVGYGRKQGLKFLDKPKISIPRITKKMNVHISESKLISSGIYLVVRPEYESKTQELFNAFIKQADDIFESMKLELINHGSDFYTISTTVLKKQQIKLEEKNEKTRIRI